MTIEEAKQKLPIIQAYAEGKEIEMFISNRWVTAESPGFMMEAKNYRIKSEPKYRPFKTKEECWNEMHKHSDFGWLIKMDTGIFVNIKAIISKEIVFDNDFNYVYTFKEAFKYYKFTDNTPFGIKDENNIE